MTYKSFLAIGFVVTLFVGGVVVLWVLSRQPLVQRELVTGNTSRTAAAAAPVSTSTPKRIPAFQSETAVATLAPTLNPEGFTGSARAAYAIAKEIPGTLAQIPCYCHCDRSKGHKSLHSCFVDDHGEGCGTCMNEAMTAYKLKLEKRLSDQQIREAIIKEYGR